jgi:hypothetical protein
MEEFATGFLIFLGALVLALGIGLVCAFPIMWISNYLFSPGFLTFIFGMSTLTFWKAYWFSVFMSWMVKGSVSTTSKD